MRASSVLVALLITALSVQSQTQRVLIGGKEALAGRLIVRLKPQSGLAKTVQLASKSGLLRQLGATVGTQWMTGSELWIVQPAETERALSVLKGNPLVEYVSPDYLCVKVAGSEGKIPNDPMFSKQWQLLNTGQTGGTPGADVRATEAWNITTGDSTLVVAVLDTGVDIDHPDLKANIWINKREVAGNGIDDDGNQFVDDVFGWDFIDNNNNPRAKGNSHGTGCAGLIAASQNNGIGVSGVAPSVKIMSVRMMDSTGVGPLSAAVCALEYAVNNGARIINCSFTCNEATVLDEMLALASQKGILVVAAVGNTHSNLDADGMRAEPASSDYPNIVSVGNSTSQDQLCWSSSYGQNCVDVVAPGDGVYTTDRGGGYFSFSGTSASAPVTSGVAALVWSAFPGLTAVQVRQQLILSSDLLPALYSRSNSNGRINAHNAVRALYLSPVSLLTRSLDFGIVNTNAASPAKQVMIRNDSGSPIVVDSLVVGDGFTFIARDTSARKLSGLRIGAKDSTTVNVYFAPSFPVTFAGVLRLYHTNAYNQVVQMVSILSGQGVSDGPVAPSAVSPADGAADLTLYTTLSWTKSIAAVSYHLQVALRSDFSVLVSDLPVADTTRTIGPMQAATTYYWRVNSVNAGGSSGWSPTRSFTTMNVTSVDQATGQIPKEFSLGQNFPNPFNPSTTILFSLPVPSRASLKVFDVLGREVVILVSRDLNAGWYSVEWQANAPSGVYYYRLETRDAATGLSRGFVETKRMILLK